MIKQSDRKVNRSKRHRRVRVHVAGTPERPRLAVFRSLNHVYAQLIDDGESRTLAAASTVALKAKGNGMAEAAQVGKEIAAKAKAAGVTTVGVTYGLSPESLREAPPDVTLSDIRDLPPLLAGA